MTLDPIGGLSLESMKPGSSMRRESLTTQLKTVSDYMGADPESNNRLKQRRKKLRKKRESDVLDIVRELESQKDDAMGRIMLRSSKNLAV